MPSCLNSFWHGVIPTFYFIFNDFYTCIIRGVYNYTPVDNLQQVEEMRDEYILKMKLRDGAINLSQALSSQSSKAAKEKLQAVRVEQRDLIEVERGHV